MSRKSTLSPAWKALATAVGGATEIANSLGMSQTTFYRVSRGFSPFPDDKREALEILCDLYNVPNPIEAKALARSKDLTQLRMLGDALEKELPIATRTLEKLRTIYPREQLIELAESDGTPENILRGVTMLLETD